MKKTLIIAVSLLLCLCTICACGKKEYNIDKAKLASELAASGNFLDTVAEIPAELISHFYQIDNSVSAIMYKSSVATAEEITIFEAADSNAAAKVYETAKAYLETQAKIYDAYNATEAARLRCAICKQYGKYVVVCVCNDNVGAQEIINEYFK